MLAFDVEDAVAASGDRDVFRGFRDACVLRGNGRNVIDPARQPEYLGQFDDEPIALQPGVPTCDVRRRHPVPAVGVLVAAHDTDDLVGAPDGRACHALPRKGVRTGVAFEAGHPELEGAPVPVGWWRNRAVGLPHAAVGPGRGSSRACFRPRVLVECGKPDRPAVEYVGVLPVEPAELSGWHRLVPVRLVEFE